MGSQGLEPCVPKGLTPEEKGMIEGMFKYVELKIEKLEWKIEELEKMIKNGKDK